MGTAWWLQVECKGRQPGLVQNHLHSTFPSGPRLDLSSRDPAEQHRHRTPSRSSPPLILLPHSLSYLKPQIQPGRAHRAVGCRVAEQMRTLELREACELPRSPSEVPGFPGARLSETGCSVLAPPLPPPPHWGHRGKDGVSPSPIRPQE